MREWGRILRIEEGKGIVQLDSRGTCKSCGMNTYCHSMGTGKRELTLELEGKEYVPGDSVEIETQARSLVTAAFLVFILPLILSIAAYFIMHGLTGRSDIGLAGFFGCFVLSELFVAWIDRSFGRSKFFQPRIVRKIE